MWSIFTIVSCLLPCLALPSVSGSQTSSSQTSAIRLLQYNEKAAYTKFSLPSSGCLGDIDADDDLALEFQVNATVDIWTSDITVNGQKLDITWKDSSTESFRLIHFTDQSSRSYKVNLSWTGTVAPPPPLLYDEGDVTQNIHFFASPVDCVDSAEPTSGFLVVMRPTSPNRLVGLIPDSPSSPMIDFQDPYSFGPSSFDDDSEVTQNSDEFDVGDEMESLRLLETQAHQLQTQIAAKKKAIAYDLKQERDKLCLKHLIKECDGVVCAAKAIAQRLCDKVGIVTVPSLSYAQMKNPNGQHMATFSAKNSDLKHDWHSGPAVQSHGQPYAFQATNWATRPNLLIRALQAILAVLGIYTLITFIRRKCMSKRCRTERAADLEERRNARAYKRAARRALMRQRWNKFICSINCFSSRSESRTEDYEEKRALILQDAFLEQDLDQAEKGEVMEAEIRELRNAHELVSNLVGVDENRHDPGPSFVPLQYTLAARSRGNSTPTLPPYSSESLPDYSSRLADSENSSSCGDEDTPPTSNGNGRSTPMSEFSGSSRSTKCTPTSSVLEMSPRASEETLRTRPSRDTQDR